MRVSICAVACGAFLLGCGGSPGPRLVVVEEHHLAWPVWEEARRRGEIGPGAVLLHLDAHEDLGEPDTRIPPDADPRTARRIAERDLAVDGAIVPALTTGTVGRVVWVVPPWLGGAEAKDPRVRVVGLADLAPIAGEVVLDVDLDFFACENPHAGHLDEEITREEYERLLAGGRVRMAGEAREGDLLTRSIVLARPPGPFAWPVRLDRVRDEGTGEERFLRGFVCLGRYRDAFPVHDPTIEESAELARRVEGALRRAGVRPRLVTVARSATSGFVPAARVAAIEREVLAMLGRLLGEGTGGP